MYWKPSSAYDKAQAWGMTIEEVYEMERQDIGHYPHFPGRGKPQPTVKLSEIRAAVSSHDEYREHDRACNFYSGLPKKFARLQKKFGEEDEPQGRIPPKLHRQIVGQTLGPEPLQVRIDDFPYIVTAIAIDGLANPPVGYRVRKRDRIVQVWVLAAQYIELEG